MIKRNKASITKFIIHKVGNKFNDGKNAFSEAEVHFDQASYELMLPFLLRPFGSVVQSYRFNHHADISLNEVNAYAATLFKEEANFVETSKNIVKHLFEQSNSAQIKTGDVIIAEFEGIEYNDMTTNAIGIFKIENKVDFFQTYLEGNSYDVAVQKGINARKVDKGCLILNQSDTEGYIVFSVDHNNYDAQYWINHFLNITYANDANQHTQNYIEFCKDFSEAVVKNQFGNQEQNNFIAKAIDYFKENEAVNIDEFKEEVFEDEEKIVLFEDYKKAYEQEQDLLILNHFDIADAVVKKAKKKIKTEIQLDTNIQIKLDIDAPEASSEYLERGYDSEKKMHFYKVFFNEEG